MFKSNQGLGVSLIIINYWIIINVCYKINALHKCYTPNKGLLDESDKEENVELVGAAVNSSLKRRL
jgi:hypothetical protein